MDTSRSSDVFIILLIISWFNVAIRIFSGLALLFCNTRLLHIGFWKNLNIVLFIESTQMDMSRVGNSPAKSSSDSIVRVRKLHTLFIIPFTTSSVFWRPVIPLSLSSILQALLNTSLSLSHLHPSLTFHIQRRISSMYLIYSSTVRLDCSIISNSCLSHQSITKRAIQQVLRSLMGPPYFWR